MRHQAVIEVCLLALAGLAGRLLYRHGRKTLDRWAAGLASAVLPPRERARQKEEWEFELDNAAAVDGTEWIWAVLNLAVAAVRVAAIRWTGVIRRAQRPVGVVAASVVTATLLLRSPSGALIGFAFGFSMHRGVIAGERAEWFPRVAGTFARLSQWTRRGLVLAAGVLIIAIVEGTILLPVLWLAPRLSVATQLLTIAIPTGLAFGALLGLAYRHVPTGAMPVE